MALRALRTFVAVAERGGISAAAGALFLSVPAVSAQIAGLEAQLGVALLDRSTKPARLNVAGQALLGRAREIIARYEQLAEGLSEAKDLSGTLTLGSIPTALTSVIPRALSALKEAHPNLQIRVHHGLSPSFSELLRHGEVDAAIISEPRSPLPGIAWQAFAEEPVMVIAPRQARGRTDEALLRELPYIRFNRHFWVSGLIEESLVSRGIVLRESMELDSLEAIALMARHGLGASIIPVSHAGFLRFHKLKAVPFGKPPLSRRIGLAQRASHPKQRVTRVLLEALVQAARRDGAARKRKRVA